MPIKEAKAYEKLHDILNISAKSINWTLLFSLFILFFQEHNFKHTNFCLRIPKKGINRLKKYDFCYFSDFYYLKRKSVFILIKYVPLLGKNRTQKSLFSIYFHIFFCFFGKILLKISVLGCSFSVFGYFYPFKTIISWIFIGLAFLIFVFLFPNTWHLLYKQRDV